jgi:PAS domain S-box-containing protein
VDIRTKLIFALVSVALASLFVFGAVIAPGVEERLRTGTLDRLDELAEAKRETLMWVVEGWRERIRLVSSRTQLRSRLDEHERTGSDLATARIREILTDALGSSRTLLALDVYDSAGALVVSVDRGGRIAPEGRAASVPDSATYEGVEFGEAVAPEVAFVAPLVFEGRSIGTLRAVFEARELLDLAGHYSGLGQTGEVLLVARDEAGRLRTLHPTRHALGDGASVLLAGPDSSLAARALAGEPGPFDGGAIDYRGESVWAATRLVPEVGWGLVVQVDEIEQLAPSVEFRESLRRTALILAAFAILAGFALGLRLAIPIQDLAEVADRIRAGDLRARAKVGREDEVGLLARTFNEMAGELEKRLTLLHEFQRFFDVSIDLMCMAGTDGYFKRLNPAFRRELGWTEEELLGRPFVDFVHPDDVERTLEEVGKLAQGIPTVSFENRYRCKDGGYKRLRWATYPDRESGVLYAVAHVIADA